MRRNQGLKYPGGDSRPVDRIRNADNDMTELEESSNEPVTPKKPRRKKLSKPEARKIVLRHIRSATVGMSVKELAVKMGTGTGTIYTAVNGLVAEGMIKKVVERSGFRYFHRKVSDDDIMPKPRVKIINNTETFSIDLRPVDFYNFLLKWQNPWEPRIFESARNLPLGLARLFELAVEQVYGGVVSKDDIDTVRISIDQFRKDLEQTLRVVNGFLDNTALWDTARLAHMTIADNDLEKVKTASFKVKEAN